MKIISFTICPFVQRVTAVLERYNMPYEIEFISLKDKPDWFLELSPLGQVPILVTDQGEVLHESGPIVEYLAEMAPDGGWPLDPVKRAQARAWSDLAAKNYLVQCGAQRSPNAIALNERTLKLGKSFERMEQALPESPFYHGDEPGMVDLAWLVLLHRAHLMEQGSGYDFLDGFPGLKAWQQNLLATDLPQRSVAEDFDEKFMAFYLAEETYLGKLCRGMQDHGLPGAEVAQKAACC